MQRAIAREIQRCKAELHAMLGPRGHAEDSDDDDDALARIMQHVRVEEVDVANLERAFASLNVQSAQSKILDILMSLSRTHYAWVRLLASSQFSEQEWLLRRDRRAADADDNTKYIARVSLQRGGNISFSYAYGGATGSSWTTRYVHSEEEAQDCHDRFYHGKELRKAHKRTASRPSPYSRLSQG
jgi:hypothetical protein